MGETASARPDFDIVARWEIADLFLIVDYLSGRPDKNLSSRSLDVRDAQGSMKKRNLIDAICDIHWPPKPSVDVGMQMAVVFKARDMLNQYAYPASSISVAFTIMVAGESANDTVSASGLNTGRLRSELAVEAYPTLRQSARQLRLWLLATKLMLFAGLALTLTVSWHVAAGQIAAFRLDALDAKNAEFARLLSAVDLKVVPIDVGLSEPPRDRAVCEWLAHRQPGGPPERSAAGAGAAARPAARAGSGQAQLQFIAAKAGRSAARTARTVPVAAVPSPVTALEPRIVQICGDVRDNMRQGQVAQADLARWYAQWPHWPRAASALGPLGEESWQRSLLAVLDNNVLPLCYGTLGAAAAVLLSLRQKMRDSELLPRDRADLQVQLLLGVLIGSSVGLFMTPSTSAVTAGTVLATGSSAFSASTLAFLAGFGVDAAFKRLKKVVQTLFGSDSDDPKPPPTQPLQPA